MAALPEADRIACWSEFMRLPVGSLAVTKADLRAAADAIDGWVDANAASFNAAIPQPARGQLTAAQKARLLLVVVAKRFEKGA